MRILIYGAGVIGSLYAVLLKEAGYDTTIYARGHRLEALQNQGLLYKKKLLFCKWVVIIRLFTMFRAYCISISHSFWRQNCHFYKF